MNKIPLIQANDNSISVGLYKIFKISGMSSFVLLLFNLLWTTFGGDFETHTLWKGGIVVVYWKAVLESFVENILNFDLILRCIFTIVYTFT